MSTRYGIALVGLGLVVAGCGEAALETDAQVASYAVGLDVGQSLSPAAAHLDLDAFQRGVADMMAGREPAVEDSVLQGALQRFSQTIQEAMNAENVALAQKNLTDGQAFMAENANKPGVQTTPSGVQYEVITAGTGPTPNPDDQVTVHYRGTLIDGTEFDSSHSRGQPTQFTLAPGGVIDGFREALLLMPVGSTYRIVIPPSLGYGEQAMSEVLGPNSTLIFEVELISIP